MTPAQAEFLAGRRQGVFVTIKRSGRPQLSNVVYYFDGETLRLSVTDDRAKTRNARRDERVALHVTDEDFRAYLVVEGDADVRGPVRAVRDPVGMELEEVYRHVAGEHPDWDEFHQAMIDDRRSVIGFRPSHAYGTV